MNSDNNSNKNPFVMLIKNHLHKDIDSNFMEMLNTLLLLNKDFSKFLKEPFIQTLKIRKETPYSYSSLNELLHQKLNSKSNSYQSDTDVDEFPEIFSEPPQKIIEIQNIYYFGDFLTLKLKENLRRLYAFYKSKSNYKNKSLYYPLDNEANLLQQQDNIYFLIQKFFPYNCFDTEKKSFPKLLLGKDCSCTIQENLLYSFFHQNISSKNISIHLELLKNFSFDNISSDFISFYEDVSYLPNKQKDIQSLLKNLPNEFFYNLINNLSKDLSKGSFLIDFIEEMAKRNLPIEQQQKNKLLYKILSNYNNFLFHNSSESIIPFYENIKDYFKNNKILEKDFFSSFNIKFDNALSYLMLKFIPKFNDPTHLINKVLSNEKISPNIKNQILHKYDFTDLNFISNLFDNLNPTNEKSIQEVMTYLQPNLNNEILSLILVKNNNFFKILKPYYEQHILNQELNVKYESVKKLKL